MKRTVVIGILGATLDQGREPRRWDRWRPTVGLCQQDDLVVSRFELLHPLSHMKLARQVVADIAAVSPETEVRLHAMDEADPWDFEEVWENLYRFARAYPFDTDAEDYLVHITTGTHVAQICLFLLTEARYFPARLVQTGPARRGEAGSPTGAYAIIDLDLSRYDRIAARFREEADAGVSFLKAGIDTRNVAFNRLIERIETVAVASRAPILLTGPTGAGKTLLARRIYELKRARRQVAGRFVDVNCATLRGDGVMAALFGHTRGAFTGAVSERLGLLRAADGGVLFLDEIGELGLEEQAMLLRAIESRTFLPVGSEREVTSDFQLLAGTNRDLRQAVRAGRFREDLLARIDLWTFRLPALADRIEDLAPNLEYELDRLSRDLGRRVSFSREALDAFLAFATGPEGLWPANFRELGAAVTRMATLAPGGRITLDLAHEETARLRAAWSEAPDRPAADAALEALLGADRYAQLDRFDRVQLADVVAVCRAASSLSAAGRVLFAQSRTQRTTTNDADRLRKYLARFGLSFADLSTAQRSTVDA